MPQQLLDRLELRVEEFLREPCEARDPLHVQQGLCDAQAVGAIEPRLPALRAAQGSSRIHQAEVSALVGSRQELAPGFDQPCVALDRARPGLLVAREIERGVPAKVAVRLGWLVAGGSQRVLQGGILQAVQPLAEQQPRTQQRVRRRGLRRPNVILRRVPTRLIIAEHRREGGLCLQGFDQIYQGRGVLIAQPLLARRTVGGVRWLWPEEPPASDTKVLLLLSVGGILARLARPP